LHATRYKVTQLIPPSLWPPNSPDLNPVDYSVWEYSERTCTKHASLICIELSATPLTNGRRDKDVIQLGSLTPFSVAVSVRPDQ